MYLLPAIDLLEGKVVRLARGDYDAVTIYHDDPVEQARRFSDDGAQWLHVVDLDGARTGVPSNCTIIETIIAATSLKVEVGGGVRSFETLARLAGVGASRVVLGTGLVADPDFVQEAVARYGDLICAGIDARAGQVAVEGWRKAGGASAVELAQKLSAWGVCHLVYTDIARDGMQTGIDATAYEQMAQAAGLAVIASGGISTLDDLRALAALGDSIVEGTIVGRALYESNFTVAEALAALDALQLDKECS
jgi:phosphoribosylformimino-5-aminoimidazole carboxamide ribotide isomerase